jgi:hypothetical protein
MLLIQRVTLTALTLTIAFAPADARASGSAVPQPIAEIVTFRLMPGTKEAAFLSAAKATAAPLANQPGFLRRSLGRDETGLWTDYVEWADMPSAESAAQAVLQLPEVAPFLSAIDPNTMEMSHRTILWQMGD